MCTIRRSKIKKLIRQQRKILIKPLIEINFNHLPKISWEEWFKMWNKKGIVIGTSIRSVKKTTTRPRIL